MRTCFLTLCVGVLSMAWPGFAGAQSAGGQPGLGGSQSSSGATQPGSSGSKSTGGYSGSASTGTTKKPATKAEWRDDLQVEMGLEFLLEQVVKNNPDIRVAEMKLQEAEAELNRARMAAVHKIVVLQSQLRSARAELADAEKNYTRMKQLIASNAISATDLAQGALAVLTAKEKFARLEAEQPYLIGKAPGGPGMGSTTGMSGMGTMSGGAVYRPGIGAAGTGSFARWTGNVAAGDPTQGVSHTKTEKLRALLKSPVKWPNRKAANSLRNVVDDLRAFVPGFAFEIMTNEPGGPKELPGPSFSGELPLSAIVQWIEDRYEVKFVVRDYGIVVADRDRLPPGALPLLDLAREPATATTQTQGMPGIQGPAPKSDPRR